MKKILASILAELLRYTTLLSLFWGVYTGESSIISMASAAAWIVILLGVFVGFFTLLIAFGAPHLTDHKERQDGIECLEKFSKRRSVAVRIWGWVTLIVTTILLAYSGWVITAVCHVMTSLFLRVCTVIARAGIAESKKTEQPNAAGPDHHDGERTPC